MMREGELLRIVAEGQLRSASADFFDHFLLRRTPNEWTRWHRVVGDAMGDAWDVGHHPDDSMLKWRLRELVRDGRVELSGDLAVQMDPAAAAKLRRV